MDQQSDPPLSLTPQAVVLKACNKVAVGEGSVWIRRRLTPHSIPFADIADIADVLPIKAVSGRCPRHRSRSAEAALAQVEYGAIEMRPQE